MGKKVYSSSSYIICHKTYALMPYVDGHRTLTRVIEENNEFVIEQPVYKTITNSCSFYRGSLESATLYAQKAIYVKHKPPIIIGEHYGNPLIFFPTHSPKNKESVWFNFDAVDLVESDQDGKGSIIYLSNGETVDLAVSPIALRNQHSFAGSLRRYFKKAQNQHRQKIIYLSKRQLPLRKPNVLD